MQSVSEYFAFLYSGNIQNKYTIFIPFFPSLNSVDYTFTRNIILNQKT